MSSETWTDDDRFFLVERMREKQRAWYSYENPADRPPGLLGECKALEKRVDLMLANRKKPAPQKNLFGEDL
jgi:hypothetical protein